MTTVPPKVFTSYSHDTVAHQARVLDIADRLRADGIDAEIDQYNDSPSEGWPRWCERQIEAADFVLMVCTETYHRRVRGEEKPGTGRGVVWEAAIIRQLLYDAGAISDKFVPVLFSDASSEQIPTPIKGWSYYVVDTEDGYEGLYRRLTGQPHLPRPALGALRVLPSRDRRWSEGRREAASSLLKLEETAGEGGRMEPVTVGSLVATSLSMAAEAALKGAVGEAVKDGYKALKEKISQWASGEVAALEAAPKSIGRQTIVAEIIDAQLEDERKALRVLAEVLVARLKECAPAIGLDIGRLTALEAQLGNITVRSGIGARIDEANVGTFKTGDISVGDPPEK